MKALKCLARGERVKLKDLKLEKKIIFKLFSDNPNINSFSVDIVQWPYYGWAYFGGSPCFKAGSW